MYNKEENALIKSDNAHLGYWVANKEWRTITLFDDLEEAHNAISKLLEEGAEVYENDDEFSKKYPPFTLEDRKRISDEWLREWLGNRYLPPMSTSTDDT